MYGIFAQYCGLSIAGIILVYFTLGFMGIPAIGWAVATAIFLYFGGAGTGAFIALAVVAAVFVIPPIRAMLVSSVVMWAFKKFEFVPTISETEKVAIEAGSVWVEGELFSGKPDFNMMMKEPYPELTAEEKAFMDGPVERLCQATDDWKIWQDREIPKEVWDIIKKEKFMGMIIPKEYGGLGFTALAHSEVVKKISSKSIPVGITVMVPNSLGPAELLNHYGTQPQKDKYLRRLADGEEIPCFALTEPGAGSDAGAMKATGELFKGDDGKIYIKLNWEKRWITLAAISTVLGLAFRLKDPKNLLGKGDDLGITCALVSATTPGVTLGLRHDPMGVPFYNCPTRGKDVVLVAEDAIIGGIDGAGKGWKMLMECLGAGRGISLPAQSTGGTKLATMLASAHAAVRNQFGLPIGKFEGIEHPLANIAGTSYILEASRKYTCGALDKGIKPAVVTAIAKFNSTELMRKAVNDAMDILGGSAISRGPRNTLSSGYIAIPIGITVEGANILTRTLMIFGQGALRAHPYAKKEVQALEDNKLGDFDKAFWGHVGHVVRNLCRSIGLSLTRGYLGSAPSNAGELKCYYKKLSWASASFAIMADVAMGTLGGTLKFREQLTGRFADILSWMYMGTAVLRRYEAEGRRKEDLPFVHYSMQRAMHEIQTAFDGIFANFQGGGLGWLFCGIIAPWSRLNRLGSYPSDTLIHKVASLIQTPGAQRSRMIEGVFLSKDPSKDQPARMEEALLAVKAAEDVERKVKKAVREKKIAKAKGAALYADALAKGVISQAEFDMLSHSEKLRWNAIQVDEFTLEQYSHRA